MQGMRLRVVALRGVESPPGTEAVVIGRSRRRQGEVPEMVFVMKLRLPPGASAQEAGDLALEYLDPA